MIINIVVKKRVLELTLETVPNWCGPERPCNFCGASDGKAHIVTCVSALDEHGEVDMPDEDVLTAMRNIETLLLDLPSCSNDVCQICMEDEIQTLRLM